MSTITLKNHPALQRIVRDLCRKQKAYVYFRNEVTLSGTYWDGGSISNYLLVDIKTGNSLQLPGHNPPQFGGPMTAPTRKIDDGCVIVKLGTFCGKPATPSIYIPDNSELLKEVDIAALRQ